MGNYPKYGELADASFVWLYQSLYPLELKETLITLLFEIIRISDLVKWLLEAV